MKSLESVVISKRLLVGDARRGLRSHVEEHHALVQHLVVLEVVHERGRRRVGSLVRNTAVPGTRTGFDFCSILMRSAIGIEVAVRLRVEDLAAAGPGPHDDEHGAAEHQRHPSAVQHLVEVGDEEPDVDGQESADERKRAPERPAPELPDDEEGERRRRHHGAGDRDAVGVRELVRRAEEQHQRQHAEQQHAVDPRYEDLSLLGRGGVHDLEPRQQAELDRLAGERVGAGDDRLAGDHRRGRRQKDQRHRAPSSGP